MPMIRSDSRRGVSVAVRPSPEKGQRYARTRRYARRVEERLKVVSAVEQRHNLRKAAS